MDGFSLLARSYNLLSCHTIGQWHPCTRMHMLLLYVYLYNLLLFKLNKCNLSMYLFSFAYACKADLAMVYHLAPHRALFPFSICN